MQRVIDELKRLKEGFEGARGTDREPSVYATASGILAECAARMKALSNRIYAE